MSVTGHAPAQPTGDAGGFNPVCGMVSVLAQSALWGCLNYTKDTQVIAARPGELIFACRYNDVAAGIVESAAEGVRQVKEQFPQCFADDGDGYCRSKGR